jgi:hypothetical protein
MKLSCPLLYLQYSSNNGNFYACLFNIHASRTSTLYYLSMHLQTVQTSMLETYLLCFSGSLIDSMNLAYLGQYSVFLLFSIFRFVINFISVLHRWSIKLLTKPEYNAVRFTYLVGLFIYVRLLTFNIY